MSLHEFSLTTTPEMLALLALVRQRMLQPPDEAAKAQRDFEVSLREHMLALERGVHVADFGRRHGIVVDGSIQAPEGADSRGVHDARRDDLRGADELP